MIAELIIQLLAPMAIFVAIIAFWLSYRNFRKFGSVLGVSYDLIILMLAVATAAFILHAFVDNSLLPDNIITKLMSQSLFVFEAVLIVAASRVAKKHYDDLFRENNGDNLERSLKESEERLKRVEEEE